VNVAQIQAIRTAQVGLRTKVVTVATLVMIRHTAKAINWATARAGDMWRLSDGAGVPVEWEN
jgi:hypothetical protein